MSQNIINSSLGRNYIIEFLIVFWRFFNVFWADFTN